ncbi:MAG: hypothetical protein ACOZFS_04050 [Thermodesulfobacteriota bacterium]
MIWSACSLLYREHVALENLAAVELALEHQISKSAGVRHILLHTHVPATPASLSHWPATLLSDFSIYGQLGEVP